MLFFTVSRDNFEQDLLEMLGIEEYKARKRLRLSSDPELLRLSSDPELVMPLPKIRKTSKSNKFEVKLDVSNFRPEDIKVKTVGKDLIVEGKHDERRDENGFVSRQFTRRYEMPKDIDLEQMTSKLSLDGKLSIEAPLKQTLNNETVIPITITDKSEDITEDKKEKASDAA